MLTTSVRVAGARTKRTIAIVLAAALVLTVAGFAVSGGLGAPSVPEGDVAVVDGADPSDVTMEQFDAAMLQAAAGLGQDEAPPEGDDQYPVFRDQVMSDILTTRWILGEAEEQGILVADREQDRLLEEIKELSFSNEEEFETFKEDNQLSDEDVRQRVLVQAVNERLQQRFATEEPPVSGSEARAYFDQNEEQYSRPASRDVRVVFNEDRSKVEEALIELEADDSNASWRRVARRFSEDDFSQGRGGRLDGLVEGARSPELDAEVFAASEGELVGPFEADDGFYVTQVDSVTSAQMPTFAAAREGVIRQIVAIRQQTVFAEFQSEFLTKWKARTVCAEGFIIDRCHNAPSPDPIPDAPPVQAPRPVEPGFADLVAVPGLGLPQGPIPALPEDTGGLPPELQDLGIPGVQDGGGQAPDAQGGQ